jgi:hypothetical protein
MFIWSFLLRESAKAKMKERREKAAAKGEEMDED